MESLLQIRHGHEICTGQGETPAETLCRTLVANALPTDLPMADCAKNFRSWWAFHLPPSCSDLVEHMLLPALDENTTRWLPSPDEILDMTSGYSRTSEVSFIDSLIATSWAYRAFFLTEEGYIGLGPQSLESKDEVWLLEGGRTPFILRSMPDQGGYALVGEAYVLGMMFGEMMTPEMAEKIGSMRIC